MRKYFEFDYPRAQGDTILTGIRHARCRQYLISGNYREPPSEGQIGFVYLGSLRECGRFFNLAFPSMPGAIVLSTTLWGPEFLGSGTNGIPNIRVCGSYITFEQPSRSFGCLYSGPLNGTGQWRSVNPEGSVNTVLRSTVDQWVVGNYDTAVLTDRALLYNIPRRLFQDISKPGATTTTANGICRFRPRGGPSFYLICGSFTAPATVETGYTVELHTGGVLRNWREYHYNDDSTQPTRFNGISSDPSGEIFLTGDLPVSFLLRRRLRSTNTWQQLQVPDSTSTAANSVAGTAVVGTFLRDGVVHGFTSIA